jgi:hypothetical protein
MTHPPREGLVVLFLHIGDDHAGAVVAAGSLLLVRIPRPQRSADDAPALGLRHDLVVGRRELSTQTSQGSCGREVRCVGAFQECRVRR